MLSPVRPSVLHALLFLASLAGLPACATYNDKVAVPLGRFEAGDFARAEAAFADPGRIGSGFLRGVEAGSAALARGDFEAARQRFHQAIDAVEHIEERAALGVESIGESLMAFALNEEQQSYVGEGYERVMAHSCLGLVYLALGKVESVLVEARRVDELLTAEEQLYGTDYAAGGLGHFLSALAYELVGKPGEAYIDYQRLEEKGLGGELTQRALVRLSGLLGRKQDHEQWVESYGPDTARPDGAASIVLVGGTGMGPGKVEVRIDVPISGGVFSWAVPQAVAGPRDGTLALAFPEQGFRLQASLLEDVSAVAAKNLADRIAWLAARSAIRGLLKRQLADQLRDNGQYGELMSFAASVFTIATERADLRAWRTLPADWQGARAFLTPEEPVRVAVGVSGGETVELGTFRLTRGETMFVLARSIHGRVYAHAIGGERLPAP